MGLLLALLEVQEMVVPSAGVCKEEGSMNDGIYKPSLVLLAGNVLASDERQERHIFGIFIFILLAKKGRHFLFLVGCGTFGCIKIDQPLDYFVR